MKYHLFANEEFGKLRYWGHGYKEMYTIYTAGELGDNFIWLADMQQNMQMPLYIDSLHYTGEMSKRIAIEIAEEINKTHVFQERVKK